LDMFVSSSTMFNIDVSLWLSPVRYDYTTALKTAKGSKHYIVLQLELQ
jgi:hypothetical protein